MKIAKGLFGIVVIFGIIGIFVWNIYLKDQVAYAQIASAYGAKQVCSCRFIGERELQSCLGDFTNDISALSITQKDTIITAKAPFGLAHSRARYTPKLGCSLIK